MNHMSISKVVKLPTANDLPVENVNIDQNGHYDAWKSPNFHKWMVDG